MCMQCMMGAMAAGAGATGTRSWLATRRYRWLTPRRMRAITIGLLGAALMAASVLLGGSGN
jgi:homoaconitase/3-isopropylmalate dehydratase large subunit